MRAGIRQLMWAASACVISPLTFLANNTGYSATGEPHLPNGAVKTQINRLFITSPGLF